MSISRIKNDYVRRAAIILYVPFAILFTGLMNFLLWLIAVFEVDEWTEHARKVWRGRTK